ncbi:mRNA turnover protein 4 homolog [Anopheles ziemanni]|uniref:mRNA turnover protein 4 homolog n=1 Tax=Anopheles coustani TaxID=139045 RepID=UPI00265B17F6|nr:mRNA turnover protein 4 homolog [Anopheles coustani]XP_058176007.1 mRNA turnover protein 4 homolog [Anopheles ziemanni]
MPKSRRDKKVSLTKTDRKGLSNKQQIIEEIQQCRDKYDNIFLFSVQNMRNSKLKEVRAEWKKSRFFFGKNRVMQLGLKLISEADEATELEAGMEQFRDQMIGQCGLLFTSEKKKTVLDWFNSYSAEEYARSGFRATETVELKEGPLEEFSHAIEPHLRSLGLPTKLNRGVVTLYKDYTVCVKGKVLTPEQARILKLIGKPIAKFKLVINCALTKKHGFEMINKREIKVTKKTKKSTKDKKDTAKKTEEDMSEDGDEDDDDEEMELDDDEEDDEDDDEDEA